MLVFLALRHMLYLFICVFVFMYLCMRHLGISVWISLDLSFQSKIRWRPVFLLSSKKRTRKGVPSFPICSNILRLSMSSAKYQKVIFDVVCLPACLLFKHLLNKISLNLALLYFYQAPLPCSATTSASAATLAQVSLCQSFKINLFLVWESIANMPFSNVLVCMGHLCLMIRRDGDASVQSVGQCPVPPAPATPRLMALLAVALQPLFWGHLFVRILQTAVVPFNLMHHQPTSSYLALQWLQNVCKASPPNVFRVFYV